MSSPATIPLSNAQPAPPTATSHSQPPISTPAFRSFLTRLNTSLRQASSHRRPWLELIDRSALTRPDNLTDALTRIRKNASYFRVNYLLLLAGSLAVSLISHPFSLLLIAALLAAWCFLYLFRPSDQPLLLFGRSFSDRETLGALLVATVFLVFLTSVGSLLISAVLIGVAIVCVHGAFRVPEDLFLDDQEPGNAGLLSFLGGAASSAAASSAPAVAGMV